MTATDHIRALLAVTSDRVYRTAEEQDVITAATAFIEARDKQRAELDAALAAAQAERGVVL